MKLAITLPLLLAVVGTEAETQSANEIEVRRFVSGTDEPSLPPGPSHLICVLSIESHLMHT